MTKGVSIKFKSYSETIPKLLELLKLDKELVKHDKIILKPSLRNATSAHTSPAFLEQVLRFCLAFKTTDAEVFIAEGSDGVDTMDLFESVGYKALAERYNVGLIDLNHAEVDEMVNADFLKFERIMYPHILRESFVISLPKLADDAEVELQGALSNMLGAYPASYYKGLFARDKSKIKKWPVKYTIHDILLCKMPEFAIIDASEKGVILAGVALDMDLAAAKLLGKDEKSIAHLKLVKESIPDKQIKKEETLVEDNGQ